MFEKLVDVEKRYDELSNQLQDPDVVTNQENYRNIMKEYKQLTPLIEKFREYKAAQNAEKEALEILSDSTADKDFKELAMATQFGQELSPKSNSCLFLLCSRHAVCQLS